MGRRGRKGTGIGISDKQKGDGEKGSLQQKGSPSYVRRWKKTFQVIGGCSILDG